MVNKLLNSENYSYHDVTKATTNILITELKSMTEWNLTTQYKFNRYT